MDFIERWLHISPDSGNGSSELLMLAAVIVTILSVAVIARRAPFARKFIAFLERLGRRENSDRFDN